MCLSLCICLQLPMQITSHKHTHKHAKEKGSLDYVGSDGLEGRTKTHLETIGDTKRTKRGKLQEGVRGRVKNQPSCRLLVCFCNGQSHIQTHKHPVTSKPVPQFA